MSISRNGRLAVIFFIIYLLLYSGFMFINVVSPDLMELTPLLGVNLAIWYGFGLIFAAVILAFLYGTLCTTSPSATLEVNTENSSASDPGEHA